MVLELLRGAELEATSRKYGVTAATLTSWREAFLEGGEAGLKSRTVDVVDQEKKTLKSAVTGLVMDNELLRERIRHLEGRETFSTVEVEQMSRTPSPSTGKPYGLARVAAAWGRAQVHLLCAAEATEPSGRAAQARAANAVHR